MLNLDLDLAETSSQPSICLLRPLTTSNLAPGAFQHPNATGCCTNDATDPQGTSLKWVDWAALACANELAESRPAFNCCQQIQRRPLAS